MAERPEIAKGAPSLNAFLRFVAKNEGIVLSEYQVQLAEAYIIYRRKHFEGGLRTGRTTVIELVKRYLDSEYKGIIQYHEKG